MSVASSISGGGPGGGSGGAGGIGGSTGATDNAVLRADGAGGATLQTSAATIDDTGNVQVPTSAAFNDPSLRIGEVNTGIANDGTKLRLVISGAERVRVLDDRVTFLGGVQTAASFAKKCDLTGTDVAIGPNDADMDTGLGSSGANALSLIAGGVEAARTTATRFQVLQKFAITRTSSAAGASTTEYPNSGDFGMHLNTSSGLRHLVINDGGAIYTVQLS